MTTNPRSTYRRVVYTDTQKLLQAFDKQPSHWGAWDADNWWAEHTEPGLARTVVAGMLYSRNPHKYWWLAQDAGVKAKIPAAWSRARPNQQQRKY